MRLLLLSDVETSPGDRVFYHSRTRALLAGSVVAGAYAFVAARLAEDTPGLWYYLGALFLLVVPFFIRYLSARFRPTNWLVRMTPTGLFIKFRSYLNYRSPDDAVTVLYLDYSEIRSARRVRARMRVPDPEGGTMLRTLRFVELELHGDTGPLAAALEAELARPAPKQKRWYGSSSTLYHDYPVRMMSPSFLRIRWSVLPRASTFLQALLPYTAIAEPVAISEDFAAIHNLPREEQEKRLRELEARGEHFAAIHMARQLYGLSLTEAEELVESLRQRR